jgi:hypothetical protein
MQEKEEKMISFRVGKVTVVAGIAKRSVTRPIGFGAGEYQTSFLEIGKEFTVAEDMYYLYLYRLSFGVVFYRPDRFEKYLEEKSRKFKELQQKLDSEGYKQYMQKTQEKPPLKLVKDKGNLIKFDPKNKPNN